MFVIPIFRDRPLSYKCFHFSWLVPTNRGEATRQVSRLPPTILLLRGKLLSLVKWGVIALVFYGMTLNHLMLLYGINTGIW